MYQRENPASTPRRRRKKKKSFSPLPALMIALLAFMIALSLPPSEKATAQDTQDTPAPPAEVLPEADEPDPEPSSRGVEPTIPGTNPVDTSSWNLVLVNPWNYIPEDYSFTLKELSNGHAVDERCYQALLDMLDACQAEGLSPLICSSYRSQAKQESLYQNKVDRLVAQGMSREEATVEAGKTVAVPGTSEHQLGLAVDIVDVNNQNLDTSQEDTAVQQWLMVHSWEYGFILRYPNEKSEITGIIYEPWHYRYVGKDAAKEIYEAGVCLEEYLGAA